MRGVSGPQFRRRWVYWTGNAGGIVKFGAGARPGHGPDRLRLQGHPSCLSHEPDYTHAAFNSCVNTGRFPTCEATAGFPGVGGGAPSVCPRRPRVRPDAAVLVRVCLIPAAAPTDEVKPATVMESCVMCAEGAFTQTHSDVTHQSNI